MNVSPRGWQLIAEAKIKAAIDDGDFDNLAGFGQPLESIEQPYDEHWWLKAKAKRENLSVLPPALVLRREVERRLEAILQRTDNQQVGPELAKLNLFIRNANKRILWGPPSDVQEYDVEQVKAAWQAKRRV